MELTDLRRAVYFNSARALGSLVAAPHPYPVNYGFKVVLKSFIICEYFIGSNNLISIHAYPTLLFLIIKIRLRAKLSFQKVYIPSKEYDVKECAMCGVYWVNLKFKDLSSIDASLYTYLCIVVLMYSHMYSNMHISWWLYFVTGSIRFCSSLGLSDWPKKGKKEPLFLLVLMLTIV